MAITPHGYLSRAVIESTISAEAMQGRAVAYIMAAFSAERDEDLSLETLTWEKFSKQLENSEKSGNFTDFNEQIITKILMPIIESALAPDQPNG